MTNSKVLSIAELIEQEREKEAIEFAEFINKYVGVKWEDKGVCWWQVNHEGRYNFNTKDLYEFYTRNFKK